MPWTSGRRYEKIYKISELGCLLSRTSLNVPLSLQSLLVLRRASSFSELSNNNNTHTHMHTLFCLWLTLALGSDLRSGIRAVDCSGKNVHHEECWWLLPLRPLRHNTRPRALLFILCSWDKTCLGIVDGDKAVPPALYPWHAYILCLGHTLCPAATSYMGVGRTTHCLWNFVSWRNENRMKVLEWKGGS